MATTEDPQYSVVVPFFNEAASAVSLVSEITEVMQELARKYEVILVNDGSTDATATILGDYAARHPAFKLLDLVCNRGQAVALYAGLRAASGRIVITMDGDGQNAPHDIPRLLEGLRAADMVVGVRVDRHDGWARRAMSRVANRVRQRILRDGIDDSGCGLKAFRREVVGALLPIRTLYSFLPAMAVAAGFTVAQCPVAHRSRVGGLSSYGVRTFLWRPILDTIGLWWYSRRCFPLGELAVKNTAEVGRAPAQRAE